MSQAMILQIETSTQVCSVALSADGMVVACREVDAPNVHATRLTGLISELMEEMELVYSDLAAIAVSKGPGSYTGLRIGVSTAKGLCYATDLPLIGIGTLDAMADGFSTLHTGRFDGQTWLCPMLDARRMEVYRAIYDNLCRPLAETAAVIVDKHTFDDLPADQQIVLFGNGADKLVPLFDGNAFVTIVPQFRNSAAHLSRLAFDALREGRLENVAYFEPYYLKDFVTTTPKRR